MKVIVILNTLIWEKTFGFSRRLTPDMQGRLMICRLKTTEPPKPYLQIKKKPHTKKKRRLIPIQDILKVLLVAQGQDRVLIGAYWHTGGRKGEILRWTWADDVNFKERWIRLGTKKSRTGENGL